MPSEAAAGMQMATAAAAMVAQGQATHISIAEAEEQYYEDRAELERLIANQQGQSAARVKEMRQIGVSELREMGAQGAFKARRAYTSAERFALSAENRIGASGVRARGTPVMAAQQNVDLAFAAADRATEQAESRLKIGGMRLASGIREEQRRTSAVTSQWRRQEDRIERAQTRLQNRRKEIIALAVAGGLPGLTSAFYNASQTRLFDASFWRGE